MKNAMTTATVWVTMTLAAQAQVEDKYHITPAERSACQSDAQSLCSGAFPDEDRLLACMRENVARLSPDCLKSFSMGLRRRHLS